MEGRRHPIQETRTQGCVFSLGSRGGVGGSATAACVAAGVSAIILVLATPAQAKSPVSAALQLQQDAAVSATIALAAAPTTSQNILATPQVTAPLATVARFSLGPLPAVERHFVADIARIVFLCRLGGLYGP